jgi:nitroreductase/dihydropteridine reductase
MNVTDIIRKRYSTKQFDPEKKIPADLFDPIKALLRFSPSSVNLQPWHFIIADTPEGKKRIGKGTQGPYAFNDAKVMDASHVILFCVKTDIQDDYMRHILDTEDSDGRFADKSYRDMVAKVRTMFVDIHRVERNDALPWMEKQVYLNMGMVLLGAAALGIDAVPLEGIDAAALDEEFGLRKKGFAAVAMIALGYRSDTDFNAALPKSRLRGEEIFTLLS